MSDALSPAQQFGIYFCNANLLPGELIANTCKDIEIGDMHQANYAWVIPLNALVNLVAIVLAPLAALFNLVAAAINGFAYLCADKDDQERYQQAAEMHANYAWQQPTLYIALHILKSGQPDLNIANAKKIFYGLC